MLEKENLAPRTGSYKRAVGVFKRREDLEGAIRALKDANFDMDRVSLLARNVEDVEGAKEITETEGNEAKEGAGIGATTGTVLGGLGGFLIGVGLLAIPGVGPILAAGAEISALASTLAGAGIGAATGGIIGALIGLGIPEEKAKIYENRVKAGDYLLMVSGTDEDMRRVQSIMGDRHVEEFEIFEAPDQVATEPVETVKPVGRVEQVAVAKEPVRTAKRVEVKEEIVEAHDLTGDGEPEVIVVEEQHKKIR
ncbi:MAG: histidine kinase [Coleofasciculaceae cyanobacterium]